MGASVGACCSCSVGLAFDRRRKLRLVIRLGAQAGAPAKGLANVK